MECYVAVEGIQLFRQRLSHKSVKVYAAMTIGIMGTSSKSLFCLIEVQSDSETRNEKEGIRVIVLFPSTMLKHLEVQSSNHKSYHYP